MGLMALAERVKKDAFAKALGEPTTMFHDVQVNYQHPLIQEAIAKKRLEQGVPRTTQAKPKQADPAPPVKAKKKGTTIMAGPLATKSQGGTGTTYRKKLLGD
jgi:hypothetical protein